MRETQTGGSPAQAVFLQRTHPYFLPYQAAWRRDPGRLRLCVKSRQVGLTYVDAYDSVVRAALHGGRDVWVMSRDEAQAKQYIRLCRGWARILGLAAADFDEAILSGVSEKRGLAQAVTFVSRASVFALSSNPDAIVGKTGHVKLDEFALHRDQRLLYTVAKPVTQWGGTLSVISTQRGAHTVFNELVQEIKHEGNPMGWSLHEIPVERAVAEGLVERINQVSGREESREAWLARQRAECLDEEQWLQEYCCVPADESVAFITYEMIGACAEPDCLKDLAYVSAGGQGGVFYVGVDVARKRDLCVLDVGELLGDVVWDRLRIELRGRPFAEIEAELFTLPRLPCVRRACLDASGLGLQLAERAETRFGWKVEPVTFTSAVKEALAFGLRTDFEQRRLRIADDAALRADLRGVRKEVSATGNVRFAGETSDSHCDRFWAKALRQQAVRQQPAVGGAVG